MFMLGVPVYCFCAVQVSQPREYMPSKTANNSLCYGSTMFMNIFVNRTRMDILQIYKKPIVNLHIHESFLCFVSDIVQWTNMSLDA